MAIRDRITNAWNAFRWYERPKRGNEDYGQAYTTPSQMRIGPRFNIDSYSSTIFNRIAVDASQVDIKHVKVDKNTQNEEIQEKSAFNYLFGVEANLDQSARDFVHDIVESMMQEGVVAVVPIDTTGNPEKGTMEVLTARVCRIVRWYPEHIKVEAYDQRDGRRKEIMCRKRDTLIIQNPLYAIVNGENATLKRLQSKLKLLDMIDDREASGKMDLILQLPYQIKSETKRNQAVDRINNIAKQLSSSKYGIGYVDATEKITQLNRPVTANILEQVENLKKELYNQLGLTENVFNGTASEMEMRNYYARSIDPVLSRITAEATRKWLTKTAMTQGHRFIFRRDPFKLVPIEQVAEIADKFSRNEILSANEIRPILGFGPSDDPKADKLVNPNIAAKNQMYGSSASPDYSQNGGNLTEEVDPGDEA